MGQEFTVYFSAGENLVYKYTYLVSDEKMKTPDNDNYNTEKRGEYIKKCENDEADGATKATCANHQIMLDEYKEFVSGVESRPTVFKKIDISKLK